MHDRVDTSKIKVVELLEALGVEHVDDQGDEVIFCCPFHDDHNPSASMNSTTTMWQCFSCEAKGNAVSFVAKYENVNREIAARWLREKYEAGFVETDDIQAELEKLTTWSTTPVIKEPLPEIEPWWFKIPLSDAQVNDAIDYLTTRGLADSWDYWQLDIWKDYIVIPFHDENGRLVGAKGRRYREGFPRYKVFDHFPTGRVVFGAHKSLGGKILLCEGELNAIAATQKGIPAVAISGSNLTDDQADIIVDRYDVVTVMFDLDDAGAKAMQQVHDILEPRMPVRYMMDHFSDAAEISAKELHKCYNNSVTSIELALENLTEKGG